MRVAFDLIWLSRTRHAKCPKCGKRFQRTKRVEQTVNPWNRGKDGLPKSAEQIYRENREALDAWMNEPLQHDC